MQLVIPAGGGTLSITSTTHPYRGLELTVPEGAFEGQGTWRLGVDSTVSLPGLPAGVVQLGPALVLTTDQTRASRLLTLEVPVEPQPGMVTVLVMRDPARGAIDLPLIVGAGPGTITVAGTHLNASLLPGPEGESFRTSGLSVGQLVPLSIPPELLKTVVPALFSGLQNLWPSPDAGSGLFPDGHGPAAPILAFLSQFRTGSPGLGALIKPMGAPGMLVDTAAFASVLRAAKAYREAGPSMAAAFADLAALFAGMTLGARDSLASLNLRAAMLLTKRAQLMVLQNQLLGEPPAFGSSEWAMAVGASGDALSMARSTAPASPLSLLLGPGGFQGALFRNVLDAANRPAGSVLPAAGSFLIPLERFALILQEFLAARAAPAQARGVLNKALAFAGGMPDLTFLFQPSKDAVPTPITRDTVIARDDDAAVQIDCPPCQSGTADVAVVDTVTRSEVGRSSGGGRIRLGGIGGFGLGSLPAGALKAFVGQAISVMPTFFGQLDRMVAPFWMTIMRLHFAIPVRTTLAVGDTVRYTTRVGPRTGEEWQIEWSWGDGSPVEVIVGDSVAEHEYSTPGTYPVTATLRLGNAAPLPVAARSTGTVVVGGVVTWNLTGFTGPTTSPVPPGWTFSNADALIDKLYGALAADFPGFVASVRHHLPTESRTDLLELTITTGSPPRGSVIAYSSRTSCDGAAPNALEVTGGNTDGTFTGHRVVKCADPGEVVFEDLTITKSGETIEGALVVTVRDYTYDLPNQKGYRPLQEYTFRYEFTGKRAR